MRYKKVIAGSMVLQFLLTGLACELDFEPPPPEDVDDDGFTDDVDCNDDNRNIHPDATEVCNGRDDDCNGITDDDAADAGLFFEDFGRDSFGNVRAGLRSCSRPSNHVTNSEDRDDHRRDVYPGAQEVCDGLDNDCNNLIDDEASGKTSFLVDADEDGFGAPGDQVDACDVPEGHAANNLDRDDLRDAVNPDATEICTDEIDNDCVPATSDDCTYRLVELHTADATLSPRSKNERLGWSLAAVPDLDDDGYDDLLIGAPSTGAAPDGAWLVLRSVTGGRSISAVGDRLDPHTTGSGAGTSVASADINDDGYGDIIMGIPGHEPDGPATGAVVLRYGPDAIGCEPYCDGATIYGDRDADRLGATLATGDVDGDGFIDMLLGATGRSSVYLLIGAPTGRVHVTDSYARLDGEADGGQAGAFMATGDLDDDGLSNLIISDPKAGTGRVYVHGRPSPEAQDLTDAVAVVHGSEASPIASVTTGDIDDDGVTNLILGATRDDRQPPGAVVFVFHGPVEGRLDVTDAGTTIQSHGVYANAGATVASMGDVNRDGVIDLVVGAPQAETLMPPALDVLIEQPGSLFVLHGPLAYGDVRLAHSDRRLVSSERRDLLDFSAHIVGDLDRDGHDEVAVGAWRHAGVHQNGGVVWILSGDRL
ncbi:MAG: hypothetical protein ACI9MC_000137 [Kiritimatiellia bacterium]|jgi:hypothetical protein